MSNELVARRPPVPVPGRTGVWVDRALSAALGWYRAMPFGARDRVGAVRVPTAAGFDPSTISGEVTLGAGDSIVLRGSMHDLRNVQPRPATFVYTSFPLAESGSEHHQVS